MTREEKQMIESCHIHIVGYGCLSALIHDELNAVGFQHILRYETDRNSVTADIVIVTELNDEETKPPLLHAPTLYPLDFIEGGAVIVVLPGDSMEIPEGEGFRVWAARYIAGYGAFWNMEGWEWLAEAMPRIEKGETSETAQRTAARMCARICANLATGRDVKHFPRFYLSRNLE